VFRGDECGGRSAGAIKEDAPPTCRRGQRRSPACGRGRAGARSCRPSRGPPVGEVGLVPQHVARPELEGLFVAELDAEPAAHDVQQVLAVVLEPVAHAGARRREVGVRLDQTTGRTGDHAGGRRSGLVGDGSLGAFPVTCQRCPGALLGQELPGAQAERTGDLVERRERRHRPRVLEVAEERLRHPGRRRQLAHRQPRRQSAGADGAGDVDAQRLLVVGSVGPAGSSSLTSRSRCSPAGGPGWPRRAGAAGVPSASPGGDRRT
jgi:hypothetical protein